MPVIAVFLLVTVPSVTLTAPSPHRRDPLRHRRPIASPSPNPDCPKTLARHASPPGTNSQSASALIPPHTPAPTVPPRTLFSTSERPASHDHLTICPRTPHYRTLHTAYHIHAQTLTCTSLTVTPSHSCRKRMHIYRNRELLHPLVYAHRLKHRTHTLRTPNGHAHPHLEVHSAPRLHITPHHSTSPHITQHHSRCFCETPACFIQPNTETTTLTTKQALVDQTLVYGPRNEMRVDTSYTQPEAFKEELQVLQETLGKYHPMFQQAM